jgi:hypothetical protein
MFSWFELMTEDVPAARDFYTKILGWEFEEMDMGPAGTYTVFKNNGEQVAGLMQTPDKAKEMGAPPNWGSYITVDDVDAVAAKAEEMGGTILVPLTDVPQVGRMCTVQDPTGAVISFITYVES